MLLSVGGPSFLPEVALLVLSVLGTLIGFYIIAVLLTRTGTLHRLASLAAGSVISPGATADSFSLSGVDGAARSLVRQVWMESGGRFVLLYLPHQGNDRLVVAAAEGQFDPLQAPAQGAGLSYFHPIVRRLATSGEPLEVGAAEAQLGLPVPTILFPILSRGRLIGIIAVGPDRSNRAVAERRRESIIEAVARAAPALENAQLYGSLRHAFSELEDAQRELLALQRASVAAQSTLHLDEVLGQITLGVVDGLSFDTATVYLVDPETHTLSMPVGHAGGTKSQARPEPIPFDSGNTSIRALLANEVLVTRDIRESMLPRLIEAGALTARNVQSEITVVNLPLAARGRVIGGMTLTTRRATVSDRQLESLKTFAAQAAATIENARLYGQLEQAYGDLRTAQEQLIRAERLRTLGQVASGVAHDFNNILAAIVTHVRLAQAQTRSAPIKETLNVIEQAAIDGSTIVRRIQSLRPRTEPVMEAVDLNAVVQQSIDLTQPLYVNAAQAHGTTIVTETAFEAQTCVRGQSSDLREIVTNLILNATAAMPSGGILRLHTFDRDEFVWCSVQDTGTGMSEDVKRQMFDPFFTTKGPAGSGLGMSIVAAILERHGGRILVDSELGCGTTISVGLPPDSGRPSDGRRPRRKRRVSLRVLLAEEDEQTREDLALILSRHGHRVSDAATADEAIHSLVEQEFDVVLTDSKLGDHSGWEVAEACKTVRPNAGVVLITAWDGDGSAEAAVARGVDAVLSKPYTAEAVISVLEQALVGSSR